MEHLRPNALGRNCTHPRRHLSCRWARAQYPVDYRICDGVPCRHPSVGHGPSRVTPLDPRVYRQMQSALDSVDELARDESSDS